MTRGQKILLQLQPRRKTFVFETRTVALFQHVPTMFGSCFDMSKWDRMGIWMDNGWIFPINAYLHIIWISYEYHMNIILTCRNMLISPHFFTSPVLPSAFRLDMANPVCVGPASQVEATKPGRSVAAPRICPGTYNTSTRLLAPGAFFKDEIVLYIHTYIIYIYVTL